MQDYSDTFVALATRLDEAAGYLRIDEQRARQPQLEAEMSRPDLWDCLLYTSPSPRDS